MGCEAREGESVYRGPDDRMPRALGGYALVQRDGFASNVLFIVGPGGMDEVAYGAGAKARLNELAGVPEGYWLKS